MMRATWRVLRVGGRGSLPAVEARGPGIDDLVHRLLSGLADSIHDGDTTADAWADYLLAVANLRNGEDENGAPVPVEYLADVRDKAWTALAAELPNAVRMVDAEARLLAGQLDEIAGRVGTRAA